MAELERLSDDTIRFERLLAAPVETVWRYLMDPELRAQWFAGGPTDDHVDGEIVLVFDHDKLSSKDVPYPEAYAQHECATAREKITRYDPPNAIAFSWDGGAEGEALFELEAAEGGTRLVLTHSGISGPAPMLDFAGGWHSHLAVLQTRLAAGDVEDFWALHAESQAKVAKALGVETA